MGEPIVILALRRKRDRIEVSIAGNKRKIEAAQADLSHVTASLRLLELSGDPSEFPAYIDLNRILRRGEITGLCMAALNTHNRASFFRLDIAALVALNGFRVLAPIWQNQ